MTARLASTLRAERLARGLSQGALAGRAGISRQSYSAIEAGTSVPSTDVALRLAGALATTVEALFRLPDAAPPTVDAHWSGPRPAGAARVRLARVAGRLHAYPVHAESGYPLEPADGVAEPRPGERARVCLTEDHRADRDLVALGCDPSFSLVVDRLRRERGGEALWVHRSSRAALEALASGEAHVAGMHLFDAAAGAYNTPWVRRLVPFPCTVVRYAAWQQDLLVRPGNPFGIRGVGDLDRPGLRFLNREPGSGSRTLLDTRLAAAGVAPGEAGVRDAGVANGHLAVAQGIASGLADAGVGIRAAGLAFGLDSVPLAQERYDLVIPDHFLDLPAVQALLDTLRNRALRTQVELLGGYDTTSMGLPA